MSPTRTGCDLLSSHICCAIRRPETARTAHIREGTEDAAISGLGAQDCAAAAAIVEKETVIRGNRFSGFVAAFGAGDCGVSQQFAHWLRAPPQVSRTY